MKILNLYAGIGGNRKKWPDDEIEVTAIENNKEIVKIYLDFFPNDNVIVTDAHQFLLEHFKEFDFIWSGRPCQSHSRARYWSSKGGIVKPIYPDMGLYHEIIFLKEYADVPYVVENVIGYYEPLIEPQIIGRHYIWSNFKINKIRINENIHKGTIKEWQKSLDIDISKYKINNRKDQILRNCVNPKLGLHIFNCAFKIKQQTLRRLE